MSNSAESEKTPLLYTSGQNAINQHSLPNECFLVHGHKPEPTKAIARTINLRSGHNREDYYNRHRPEDMIPTDHHDVVFAIQNLYKRIGLIRNIIDLMADFSSEGLQLKHPVKSQQRFFNRWAAQVDLRGRAHDFMKLILRDANVIVRRKMAKISLPLSKKMRRVGGGTSFKRGLTINEDTKPEPVDVVTVDKKSSEIRTIPWQYTFLNPVLIHKIGGEVGRFFGSNDIAMKIPASLADSISNPQTDAEKKFVNEIPGEVKKAVKNRKNANFVRLDSSRIYIDYYKKDDWEDWGTPFLFGVLEDIMFKEKMRLADIAALDGVVNAIRIWRLGDASKQILPTKTAVNKLLEILQHNVGGGVMDIVWDSMINLQTEYPPVDKILGSEKYGHVDRDIIRGLGVPDSLIGGSDLGTRNAESAYVQLKTLLEKLEYVRARAILWLQNELKMVADAMGFEQIPTISFSIMSLRDEAAEKQLIIQLLDRGIISVESVQQVFGYDFIIELENMKNEQKIRESEPPVLEKGNPYYRPNSVIEKQTDETLRIERLRVGADDSGGDNPRGDQPRDEGNNEPGRPMNSRDTQPRDRRTNPVLSVYKVIGDQFIEQIDSVIDPLYLNKMKVKNLRSLTKNQSIELENTKRAILAAVGPKDTIDRIGIRELMSQDVDDNIKLFNQMFNNMINEYRKMKKAEPTIKDRKSLAASTWASLKSREGG